MTVAIAATWPITGMAAPSLLTEFYTLAVPLLTAAVLFLGADRCFTCAAVATFLFAGDAPGVAAATAVLKAKLGTFLAPLLVTTVLLLSANCDFTGTAVAAGSLLGEATEGLTNILTAGEGTLTTVNGATQASLSGMAVAVATLGRTGETVI
jgi:hypothetical protein